jgi:hypothetical protein
MIRIKNPKRIEKNIGIYSNVPLFLDENLVLYFKKRALRAKADLKEIVEANVTKNNKNSKIAMIILLFVLSVL